MTTLKHPYLMSSAEFNNNIHHYFRWMRREAPVYEARVSRFQKAFLITRYDDVTAALRDPRLIKNQRHAKTESGRQGGIWLPKSFRPLMHNMLNTDEPDHRRLRNLVHKGFTPRMIANLAPRIEAIAAEFLEKARKQGTFDLIEGFALPLPVTVIAEMIGIPKEDHPLFREWSNKIVVSPTPFNLLRAVPAVRRFMKYLRRLTDQRRVDPQDDLLSALALAEEEGDRLTEDELLGTVFLLFVAGHETTVNLIANGMLALFNHPDQLDLLKENPDLIESAIEEMLRFDGPLQTTEMSFAKETFELHGVTIPQGTTVLPALLSANRDEAVFPNPDTFDITRSPNKHLAFGQGIHYCLGAPLARLEAKIAFCTLLQQMPDLRLAVSPEKLHYRSMLLLRRLDSLPVSG
ncbi:MAG: cytochrome P450 [Ardenticatenaceae bacterium]|nr:cytochrome P450 [Ardenticatenaceae bacterium]